MRKKNLLSIAGFDPSSGAGLTLDLKVFQNQGFHGLGVLTSVTAQNTRKVEDVLPLPSRFLRDQYQVLSRDVPFSGLKVGMVGSWENIDVISGILKECAEIPRVIDPVFRSSSGAWLLEKAAIPIFVKKIACRATLLTPNLEEAFLISGIMVKSVPDMMEAAKRIFESTGTACLLKGGHLEGRADDLLYDGNDFYLFKKRKVPKDVHGTGCFLSSFILCYLAKGNSLAKACTLAVEETHRAIRNAKKIGKGRSIFSLQSFVTPCP